MTQEDKELLLKDLCTRLPYGVKCYIKFDDGKIFNERTLAPVMIQDFKKHSFVSFIPYLRPMSSMTEEEKKEYESLCILIPVNYDSDLSKYDYYTTDSIDSFDWLNAHHFDYRDLIEKGLALEAPEGMYDLKEK